MNPPDVIDAAAGLAAGDRLRVAAHACKGASSALPAMLHFAATLTTDPRRGDRAAVESLKTAGLDDAAIARFAQAVTLRTLGMSDEDVIDLLHATAIFGWANRLMHNLGEPVAAASRR